MIGFIKTVVGKILRMVPNVQSFFNFRVFHLNVTDFSAAHIGPVCTCEEITLETSLLYESHIDQVYTCEEYTLETSCSTSHGSDFRSHPIPTNL